MPTPVINQAGHVDQQNACFDDESLWNRSAHRNTTGSIR